MYTLFLSKYLYWQNCLSIDCEVPLHKDINNTLMDLIPEPSSPTVCFHNGQPNAPGSPLVSQEVVVWGSQTPIKTSSHDLSLLQGFFHHQSLMTLIPLVYMSNQILAPMCITLHSLTLNGIFHSGTHSINVRLFKSLSKWYVLAPPYPYVY